ncbi:MAG: hypothetical protein WCJ68_03545 [Chitinophagia bacterium]|jgi:hypothetical protein
MKKILLLLVFTTNLLLLQAQVPDHSNAAKSDPSLPTYLVDGVEMPYAKVLKINTALIESMNVYKGPDAIAKFGNKYKHGIVLVKLKKSKK